MSEILVLGWLVLQLTDSPWQVALAGLCRTGSMFALSLIAGAVGDRVDRRKVVLASLFLNVLVAAAILALLSSHLIQPWHLFAGAVLRGGSRSFENTSRRALTFHVVGPKNLIQALSLDNIGFSIGRIIGPLTIGVLLQVTNTAVSAYSALTLLHLTSLTLVLFLKLNEAPSTLPKRPVIASITEGLKFAFSTPAIAAVLVVTVPMNVIFQYQILVPVVAQEHLHVGPGLMGLLASADGLGTILGGLAFGAYGGRIKRHGLLFLFGSIGVCAFLLGFALSPFFALSFAFLFSLGFTQVGFSTMQSGIMLMASPQGMHSRVLGAQQLAVGMGNNLGGLEIGALAGALGVTTALAVNAAAVFGLLVLIGLLMPVLRRPLTRIDDLPESAQTPVGPLITDSPARQERAATAPKT
jgi:MFS family permease